MNRNNFKTIFGIMLMVSASMVFFLRLPHQNKISLQEKHSQNQRIIEIRAIRDKWSFDPNLLNLKKDEKVTLRIINEDNYDHGFAISDFGLNLRIPARQTIEQEFLPEKEGEFSFYCSVPCGAGHYRMNGKIKVH